VSAKWRRSLAWDDRFFPAWAWPAKFVLRAFSSITLAVTLLLMVALYGILASIPIGLLAQFPTWAFYGATLVATVLAVAALGLAMLHLALRRAPRGVRFAAMLLAGIGLVVLASAWWYRVQWPILSYDPASGKGVRFFADFSARYANTTLRRLPGFEMTELEFYAWWPLRVILLTFVANMVIATVRRIEFTFVNLGVLTVHTGIVIITLGSVYYGALKREGQMILLAGQADARGTPNEGVPTDIYFDAIKPALYLSQFRGWEMRVLRGLPRYNDYALDVVRRGDSARTMSAAVREGDLPTDNGIATLSVPVPGISDAAPVDDGSGRDSTGDPTGGARGTIDPDIRVRIVGYATYADAEPDFERVDLSRFTKVPPGMAVRPARLLELFSDLPDESGNVESRAVLRYFLVAHDPVFGIADHGEGLAIAYSVGMDDARFAALASDLPGDADHGLVVRVPATGETIAAPVRVGSRLSISGYELEVTELLPEPPFPIITEGYRGATSSVAVVRVTTPGGEAYERYAYHRFPEIDQEMLEQAARADGRPARRDASADLSITYVDARYAQVFVDERADGSVRSICRAAGAVHVQDAVPEGGDVEVIPGVRLKLVDRWAHVEKFDQPAPVLARERDGEMIGTHEHAMVAVEVSSELLPGWSRVKWLRYGKYFGVMDVPEQRVNLPDGRVLDLAFGQMQRRLPDFELAMRDFEMIAYENRGAPRDYRSLIRVVPETPGREGFLHWASLNAPLRAPWAWDERRSWVSNAMGRLASGLNPRQFKFAQAGWDSEGWNQSQAMADQGMVARPTARFTILHVGNNPGIHVIALGGILMGLGIPWAFYVKPWLVRRERDRLRASIKPGVRGGERAPTERGARSDETLEVGANA
jgi:hypothetical protein